MIIFKIMKIASLLFAAVLLSDCHQKIPADLVLHHATVYTVDSVFSIANAIAVKDGKILAVGENETILNTYRASEIKNLEGRFVYPGFIDAHSHFYGYGQSLQSLDLRGTQSWNEVIGRLKAFAATHPEGWLYGSGWDQNDWDVKEFPDKEVLDSLFPSRPVFLSRVDGHAAIVNQEALDKGDIHAGQTIEGGTIQTRNGKLTGILVDNAMDAVSAKIPAPSPAQITEALLAAQKNCFAAGLTSVSDCGLDHSMIGLIDSLQKEGKLKMRLYVMLSDAPDNYKYLFEKGPVKTGRLNVRAFKLYADGALGSRGACLLEPYHDRPEQYGFMLNDKSHFEKIARLIYREGFQMCTHAIGDSANREILRIYADVLKTPNDRRWRIEHAQVVHPKDIKAFGNYSIIPSVQPTHATSDMYWAEERLGPERVQSAYAFKQLLEQNGWIPLGTDFPVEKINPLLSFYAAVFRQDSTGFPPGRFQPGNALSPEEALRGITIWAARAGFEETEKGSIEAGKFADLVIMDTDLLKASPEDILNARPLATYVGGENVL